MTKEKLAAELNSIEYPCCIPQHLKNAAKGHGLVIVYGASDDLMEIDGAIDDEIGACDETTIQIDAIGILPDWGDGIEDEATAEHYFKRKPNARTIKAKLDRDGYSWIYETDIPHATFEIMEDGEKYCRGIVFSLADLTGPAQTDSMPISLEKQYAERLGHLAHLCDTVVPWVLRRHDEMAVNPTIKNAAEEILEYVDQVRP